VPPKKQLGQNAHYTTVGLRPEEYEAIHEIQKVRRGNHNSKTSLNSILIDALWELLKKETGKNWDQIRAALPENLRTPEQKITQQNKVAEIRKSTKKH